MAAQAVVRSSMSVATTVSKPGASERRPRCRDQVPRSAAAASGREPWRRCRPTTAESRPKLDAARGRRSPSLGMRTKLGPEAKRLEARCDVGRGPGRLLQQTWVNNNKRVKRNQGLPPPPPPTGLIGTGCPSCKLGGGVEGGLAGPEHLVLVARCAQPSGQAAEDAEIAAGSASTRRAANPGRVTGRPTTAGIWVRLRTTRRTASRSSMSSWPSWRRSSRSTMIEPQFVSDGRSRSSQTRSAEEQPAGSWRPTIPSVHQLSSGQVDLGNRRQVELARSYSASIPRSR